MHSHVCIKFPNVTCVNRGIVALVVSDFYWFETEPIRLTTTFGIVVYSISSIVAVPSFDQIVCIELALKVFCFQPLIVCKIYFFNPLFKYFPVWSLNQFS